MNSICMLFMLSSFLFFFNDTATTEIYTLSLHDALPISHDPVGIGGVQIDRAVKPMRPILRSEEHTSELQSRENLVCRLLLEKKKPDGKMRKLQLRHKHDTHSKRYYIDV